MLKKLKRLKGIIYRLFRERVKFPLLAILRVCHFPPAYKPYASIPKLKNRHLGERCFIVATGPSLKIEDVEMLKDEITFSVNSIDRMYEKTEWRPTYYAIVDGRVYREKIVAGVDLDIEKYCAREAFLSHKLRPDLKNNKKASNVIFIPSCFLFNSMKKNILELKFSKNLLWGYYDSSTVVNFCMDIAQYMGIKEIYLLGVDCNYSGTKQYFDNRKDSKITNKEIARRQQERMIKGYLFYKDIFNKLGVDIYNATRGGALEVFPRVQLDYVLRNKNI